ncbi:MAG: MBL fold metallo-hydrolase, partial [Chlamydiales bacterium]|nr:MBL fold metallo-hydrolase [Chlamydiales bacterium]
MKVLFLGTGGSMGIPYIGCSCRVCTSSNTKNNRLRPSILIEENGKRYLVDSGPDFRAQALKHQIDRIDGLLLTHTHYDHIAGLDELRIYTFIHKKPIPCLLSRESLEELKVRYHYFLPSHEKD